SRRRRPSSLQPCAEVRFFGRRHRVATPERALAPAHLVRHLRTRRVVPIALRHVDSVARWRGSAMLARTSRNADSASRTEPRSPEIMSRIPDICGRLLGSTFALSVLFGCSSTPSPPNFDAGVGSAGAASGGSAGDTGGGGASGGSAGATGNSGGSSGAGGGTAGAGGSGAAGVFDGPFALGVDISSVPEAIDGGATFADTDGTAKGLLEILGAHGFNYVRLRAFVEPWALYGYANPTGDAVRRKPKPYCDTDQTAAFAQEVKAAGMGFLLNLHYSDNWADPGKQVIPEAWRDAASIADMAGRVRDYTEATVQTKVDAGARPDMVQVGNEITPGMLIHVPSEAPDPDPWGNIDKVENTVSGSIDNWDNLATLLKAGIEGVKSVDPSIRIMLHVENTKHVEGVEAWVQQARSRGV